MKTFFPSEACKETHLKSINPQSWLQVERGKLAKFSSESASSIDSLIKVPEPPILPFFKLVDYVQVLAKIHEELESCSPQERPNLYLMQFQVFKGLGKSKLMRRSLCSAWSKASTVCEKLVFGVWLKYEKHDEDIISDLLSNCGKCAKEFGAIDIASEMPAYKKLNSHGVVTTNEGPCPRTISFRIGSLRLMISQYSFVAVIGSSLMDYCGFQRKDTRQI